MSDGTFPRRHVLNGNDTGIDTGFKMVPLSRRVSIDAWLLQWVTWKALDTSVGIHSRTKGSSRYSVVKSLLRIMTKQATQQNSKRQNMDTPTGPPRHSEDVVRTWRLWTCWCSCETLVSSRLYTIRRECGGFYPWWLCCNVSFFVQVDVSLARPESRPLYSIFSFQRPCVLSIPGKTI